MEVQCVALAEALGLSPIVKRIKLRSLWRFFTPYLRGGLRYAFRRDGDQLSPPWPNVLIACGRKSIPASLFVRAQSRASGGKGALTIQIQDPAIDLASFELIVAPSHDRLKGANVITSAGSLHRVTSLRLQDEAAKLSPRLTEVAPPYLGVLVGGPNTASNFTAIEATAFARQLAKAAREAGASILLTPSRRTTPEILDAIKAALANSPAWIWDGTGDNPYFGILGISRYLVVTADSVNMATEAAAAGKPLYVWPIGGRSAKFDDFHRSLRDRGVARPFDGRLESFASPSTGDMEQVTSMVQKFIDDYFGIGNEASGWR